MSRILRQAAENDELVDVGNKAIKKALYQWQDLRLSVWCYDGLVVREPDGSPSSVIRMSTREAITTALNAMAKYLEEK